MSLKLNTASGGSITLQEADTASNLTLTVPAQAGSIVTANSSGNVGIGTSSPSAKLSIAGSTASDYTTGMTFSKSGGNTYAIAPDANDLFVRSVTAGIEVCRFTYGGNLQFNSGYGSSATAYGCRAWVNFNGTGTVAIRASGNVSSITDNGQGDYTVNFTNAMPDVNYTSVSQRGWDSTNNSTGLFVTSRATGNCRFRAGVTDGTWDTAEAHVAIFR